jgi:integrase
MAQHLEELASAIKKNIPPARDAVAWAAGTTGKLRENLVAWGLAEPINPKLMTDEGRLLGPFLDAYIASRTDAKPNTIRNYKQVRRLLCEHFGERCPINSITPSAADKWRRWMLARPLAQSSVSKHTKRAKTMLAEAVRDRLLAESPFAHLKGGSETNPARQRFIERTAADRVLDACPDADWRCIFALARFGGLRCPSEVLGLKWTDIDWDAGRLRIDSPKTGLRFCPLFPELRVVLSEAFALARDGAIHVVTKYRDGQNLRTQFGRIIERAGIVPWPKPFVNLRASRRTELQEQFPSHVINVWLGQSTVIAERHYLQVTDQHWQDAVECPQSRPPIRPPIPNGSESLTKNQGTQKPLENMGIDALQGLAMAGLIPPTGLEQSQNPLGNRQLDGVVPPYVPPSQHITPELIELLGLWDRMDEAGKSDLLRHASALVERTAAGPLL